MAEEVVVMVEEEVVMVDSVYAEHASVLIPRKGCAHACHCHLESQNRLGPCPLMPHDGSRRRAVSSEP